MLADALEHLVAGIVSNPDDVTVRDKNLRRGRLLEVRVHPEDIGKVIGRQGRTASALRTVLGALAGNEQVRVDVAGVDPPRRRGTGLPWPIWLRCSSESWAVPTASAGMWLSMCVPMSPDADSN